MVEVVVVVTLLVDAAEEVAVEVEVAEDVAEVADVAEVIEVAVVLEVPEAEVDVEGRAVEANNND